MSEKPIRKRPYGTVELARALTEHGYQISVSSVIRLFDAGRLEGYRTEKGTRRIYARELERFLRDNS